MFSSQTEWFFLGSMWELLHHNINTIDYNAYLQKAISVTLQTDVRTTATQLTKYGRRVFDYVENMLGTPINTPTTSSEN